MFPSGKWICVWEQCGEREVERGLELVINQGTVSGVGEDRDGTFRYEGTVDAAGAVRLVKLYKSGPSSGAAFIYAGQYDGEGVIAGTWHLRGMRRHRGTFELRPWDGRPAAPVQASASYVTVNMDEAADDGINEEEEDEWALRDRVREKGTRVFHRSWDGGGMAGNGDDEVWELDGQFFVFMEVDGLRGAFMTFEEALTNEDCHLLSVGSAWHEFTCSRIPAAELAARLECFCEEGQETVINGETWIWRQASGLVPSAGSSDGGVS